jgi:hypothetical protein
MAKTEKIKQIIDELKKNIQDNVPHTLHSNVWESLQPIKDVDRFLVECPEKNGCICFYRKNDQTIIPLGELAASEFNKKTKYYKLTFNIVELFDYFDTNFEQFIVNIQQNELIERIRYADIKDKELFKKILGTDPRQFTTKLSELVEIILIGPTGPTGREKPPPKIDDVLDEFKSSIDVIEQQERKVSMEDFDKAIKLIKKIKVKKKKTVTPVSMSDTLASNSKLLSTSTVPEAIEGEGGKRVKKTKTSKRNRRKVKRTKKNRRIV